MYHHRYQPQASNLANRNPSAFASINTFNNNKNAPAIASYRNSSQSQKEPSSLVDKPVTSAAASSVLTSPTTANLDSAHSNFAASGSGIFNCGNNYRTTTSASSHSSPFSSLPKQFVEERQDVIFRKVRGILNKITPETFDKLTKELVNVGLDSPRTLRGVIYLLFDKALKDLKYSSLYAKLCQELSEKAPNFEREPGPNTFCKFLISKCEDEFERRRKATEDFDSKNELTDEEFEQRTIAKQKMLGNIKFICELGKKRLLQEEILHECIRGLLSKKKKEKPIQDQAQDLECLCQIMRTIGSLLDIDASRNLMNQYFERIDMFSRKPELPSRIRFMLRDVIDLRNNNWRPRPFQREDNVPQPLSKLREELGFTNSASNASIDKLGNKNLMYINDISKLSGGKLNSLLLDDEPSFTTTTDFHWGSPFLPDEPAFDIFSNTVPNGKGESAKNASKSNNPLTKPFSSNSYNNFMDVTKMTSTLGQSMTDTFNKFKVPDMNNRIDPFSDSFKSKTNLNKIVTTNNNSDERTATNDGNQRSGFSKRNDFYQNTYQYVRGAIREPSQLQNSPVSDFARPFDKMSISTKRNEKSLDAPLLTRGTAPCQKESNSSNKFSPIRNVHNFGYTSRAPFEDSPRPPSSHRRIENSHPDFRQPTSRVITNEPMPTLSQSNSHIRQNQPCQQIHGLEHAPRLETTRHSLGFNPVNDKIHLKDRGRFNRGGGGGGGGSGGGDPRLPKFSGANYKLPGRDRHLASPMVTRDRVPNSELSQNWRADSVAIPSMKTADVVAFQSKSNQTISDPKDQPPNESKGKVNTEKQDFEIIGNNQSKDQCTKPSNSTEKSLTGNLESMLNSPNRTKPSTARRTVHDSKERQDSSRRQAEAPIEFDGRVFRRPYQNESSSLERRNFKPAMPRNQSFDSSTNGDSKRGHLRILKEATPCAITNPLLPKTPSRSTDADFSLRPSHNLAGRTLCSNQNQSQKVVPPLLSPNNQPPVVFCPVLSKPDSPTTKSTQDLKAQEPQTKQTKSSEFEIKANVSIKKKSDSVVSQVVSLFSDILNDPSDLGKIVTQIKELNIPKLNQTDCLVGVLRQSIIKSDKDRASTCKLLTLLIPYVLEVAALINAFQAIFEQLQGMEVETPKVKSLVAGYLSQTTTDGLISISEVATMLSGGKHHPMFLLYLQKLDQSNGKAWLSEKFTASKINLMDMLPEVDRSKDRLAVALRDRCLGFLDQMLTIEPDLWDQMRDRDPAPAAIYRWIKENVDRSVQNTSTFAHIFVSCLLRYIHCTTMEKVKNIVVDSTCNDGTTNTETQSNKSSPVNAVVQVLSEYEKELLSKYQHILQAILKDKQMQLASLYALQTFYHSLDFPKGALLRWFHLLYDMSIVDDDVYFTWKEELNDKYPGKGQALFQVNSWLHWLAEAESEEEED